MKLSPAQTRILTEFVGFSIRREPDGTIMPYRDEMRTFGALERHGLVRWVDVGKEGYTYNGWVITDAGRTALNGNGTL